MPRTKEQIEQEIQARIARRDAEVASAEADVRALQAEHDAIVDAEREAENRRARIAERVPSAFYDELGKAQAQLSSEQQRQERLTRLSQQLQEKIAYQEEHGLDVDPRDRQRLQNYQLQLSSPDAGREARLQAEVNRLQGVLQQAEARAAQLLGE